MTQTLSETAIAALIALCPQGAERDVDLSTLSQWRIGGSAVLCLRPSSLEQIMRLRAKLHELDTPHVVIGQTSNLLFSDFGLAVPCLQLGSRFAREVWQTREVTVEAGAWVPGLARSIMKRGLTGAEHICGIPGTIGGLIVMNGGSQRRGIGENVVWVESVDTAGQVRRRSQKECRFSYRTSVFQSAREVVTSVCLRFQPANASIVRTEMLSILGDRRRKFPRKEPNCGSVFKSNPALYAEIGPPGAIIEKLGFKERVCGGAQVSERHANFIVNKGKARAADVLALVAEISQTVLRTTGKSLEAEVFFVSSQGELVRADLVRQSNFMEGRI